MTGVRWAQRLVGAACLCTTLVCGEFLTTATVGSPAYAMLSLRESGSRSVAFGLTEEPAREGAVSEQRATLSIRLDGEPVGRQELVAIIEGTFFTRVMVSMVPGGGSGSWQAEMSLNLPAAAADMGGGQASKAEADRRDPRQRFHRIDVSFARLRGMSLAPFLRRSVYVNLEPHPERQLAAQQEAAPFEAVPDQPAPPQGAAPDVMTESAPLPGIERESVPPVLDGVITESDLPLPKPAPVPPLTMDYWQALEQRVTAQFGPRVKAKTAPARLPRVQFRLYWDGVARMIALERSSGSAQVDRAGMDSVVDAHPFPPFPDHITDRYVDVHVDFAAPKPAASPRAGKKR